MQNITKYYVLLRNVASVLNVLKYSYTPVYIVSKVNFFGYLGFDCTVTGWVYEEDPETKVRNWIHTPTGKESTSFLPSDDRY
jgi:hypothetical protein